MAAVGGSCTRRLNLMAGAIILATSARSVLGWSLCIVELVPTAVVVQMRRFGGTPDLNTMTERCGGLKKGPSDSSKHGAVLLVPDQHLFSVETAALANCACLFNGSD